MKVLVTGSDGYIGARLVPRLLGLGHSVTGFDTGLYRDGWLYTEQKATERLPVTINKDLRNVTANDIAGHDAIVHLAELSNDPLGQNNPGITRAINFEGSVKLANLAKQVGIPRFVYASSCSVYGQAVSDWVDETSPTNPRTAYAECKVKVEGEVGPMADQNFCVTFLRNATAYGASPRIRFDIVINDLCALAWTTKRIAMTSDGTPWRPVTHIDDICHAVECALTADAARVNGEIFNVGADSETTAFARLPRSLPVYSRAAKSRLAPAPETRAAIVCRSRRLPSGFPDSRHSGTRGVAPNSFTSSSNASRCRRTLTSSGLSLG